MKSQTLSALKKPKHQSSPTSSQWGFIFTKWIWVSRFEGDYRFKRINFNKLLNFSHLTHTDIWPVTNRLAKAGFLKKTMEFHSFLHLKAKSYVNFKNLIGFSLLGYDTQQKHFQKRVVLKDRNAGKGLLLTKVYKWYATVSHTHAHAHTYQFESVSFEDSSRA